MFSFSEENYLKAIFHLQKKYSGGVSTNALAEEMETKASSVTDMVKKLSEKELVKYKKYQGVNLSENGKKMRCMILLSSWSTLSLVNLQMNWTSFLVIQKEIRMAILSQMHTALFVLLIISCWPTLKKRKSVFVLGLKILLRNSCSTSIKII
jgi:DNA-binding IclR family transcriptional regulator